MFAAMRGACAMQPGGRLAAHLEKERRFAAEPLL